MSGSKSICIVGGGVIGLCTAWYARQKGHTVTVLERGAPDHDACSLGNAGMIVPSHIVPLAAPGMVALGMRLMRNPRSPFYIRPRLNRDLLNWGVKFVRAANAGHVARSAPLLRDLNLASRQCYEELAAEFGNRFGLVQKGLLMLAKTDAGLHEEAETAMLARKLGMPAEVLTPEQCMMLDPDVTMDIAGAVYFPQDCHLSPQKFISGLTSDLQQRGIDFRWSTHVTGWRTNYSVGQGWIEAVQTNRGDISADEYVVAGGSWSACIARSLKLNIPIQAGKGYSITLPQPRQLPAICSILTEARVAVTPMGETLRFAGTMEITGLDASINRDRVQGMIDSIPKYYPDFRPADFSDLPVWSGLRPCSPDGLPYIGRFRRYSNLSAATGHAMMGLSLGPITGKLMAAVLSDETPQIDIAAISPDRYL